MSGQRWWSRAGLLGYWAALAMISVGGWELQLAKVRKKRSWSAPKRTDEPGRKADENASGDQGAQSGEGKANTAGSVGVSGEQAGSGYHPREMMGRVPVLSLNGRRKFFHGLAVLMFVPGIWLDVSSVCFS